MKRLLTGVACWLVLGPAGAHDLITAESAQRYLDQIGQWKRAAASNATPAWRAEAHYRIGVALDEIRDLLNRDLAAHGAVNGLPSNFLLAELARRGVPLAYSESSRRYSANARHFGESLRVAPGGRYAADAAFRLIQGEYHDSYDVDPLAARQSAEALAEQIRLAERFLEGGASEPQREEASFILAVLYARAARAATDAAAKRRRAEQARGAIAAFEARYPGSLRAAAMPILRKALSDV